MIMNLRQICDFIGYKYMYNEDWWMFFNKRWAVMSERDIIFSPLFIKRFEQKYGDLQAGTFIREHLDDPVWYLSKLLMRWRKEVRE